MEEQMGQRVRPVNRRLALLAGTAHPELSRSIAENMGVELLPVELGTFANGEQRCRIETPHAAVNGAEVYVVQAHGGEMGVDRSLMQHATIINAARLAGAKRITAVCTSMGYARQDHRAMGEAMGARLATSLLKVAGADRLLTLDLHSDQIQGYFNGPVDHLEARPVLVDYLRNKLGGQLTIVSPDGGRSKLASRYAADLGADIAQIHKRRDPKVPNKSTAFEVIGEVGDRRCVIVDDMIDTGGTIVKAAERLREEGAQEVWVAATHAVLSADALRTLGHDALTGVVVTDSLPLPPQSYDKSTEGQATIDVVSIAPLLAEAIERSFHNESLSSLFY